MDIKDSWNTILKNSPWEALDQVQFLIYLKALYLLQRKV